MKLTKAEEQIMNHLWKLDRAFMKDIINEFPDPKPASTTIATLLKRMTTKGFVNFKQYGNVREYSPLVKKSEYFSKHINELIKVFFNDSKSQFASFFTNETNLSIEELEELKKVIDERIKDTRK